MSEEVTDGESCFIEMVLHDPTLRSDESDHLCETLWNNKQIMRMLTIK